MIARMNDESFEGGESVEHEVEVFGEVRRLFAEHTAERFAFTSRDDDPEIGLYYDQRAYDPNTGQFMSTDPVEYDTENAYRCAATNPTNCVDPTGS